ncbi:M56 family metallopeptidase [Hymenobacter sp. IS2118]|uniref:M56 family metallopeptidase n=1 Tax=Hymenobacter sp. IS2118 TaxID=1505605 RepID=UPI00068A14D3|nr:M56 family metallopeptidase [Hymenobacter sp. IS2118]
MTALDNFVSPALTRALGWTLLHSLWQGVLVAGVLAGALLLLRRQRAEVRYLASVGALVAVVILAGITFGVYFNSGGQHGVLPDVLVANGPVVSQPVNARPAPLAAAAGIMPLASSVNSAILAEGSRPELREMAEKETTKRPGYKAAWLTAGLRYFDNNLPLFVVAWLLGLLAMSLRMMGGLLYVRRLRHSRVRPLGAVWQARLMALAGRAGVRRPVALLESALVRVPLVVGHLRPVILLPLGMVAGLSPASLEAILAHEIAHVMRRDYLVNLLQTVAEVLFFYHPAVWFVAGCVRAERENCCDDAATVLCGGNALRLACALTDLAEWSQSAVVPANPRLALAAMSGRGALLSRVRRLVQRRPAAPTLAEGLLAGALVLGGLGLLGSSVVIAGPLTEPAKLVGFDWQAGTTHALPGNGSAKNPDFEKIQTEPYGSPEGNSAVFRDNGDSAPFGSRAARPSEYQVLAPGLSERGAFYRDGLPNAGQLSQSDSNFRLFTPGSLNQSLSGPLDGQQQASRPVENALREASAVKNLQAGQRAIEELSERQPVLRDREQELRDQQVALQEHIRESQQEGQDLQETRPGQNQDQQQAAQASRDQERASRDQERAKQDQERASRDQERASRDQERASRDQERASRDQERASRDQERAERERKQNEALVAQLVKDGLVKDRRNYQVKLNASSMVVNGKTQPPAVFRSYLKLYESTTGRKMSATGSWEMTMNRTSNTNVFQSGNDVPRPPRPPRGPVAPPAPPAFQAPAPPRPPQAPKADTKALRDELRKDGLIGPTDKSFQLQLNDAGLTVNGKRQSEALAAKYRKLVGHDGPGQVHTLSYSSDE